LRSVPSLSPAAEQLAAALADRYRIDRELGAGGMATVYLAQDLKHDRKVAIKVLRAELASAIGAERFLAEIRTTANLHHPHIVPLFDSGAVGGSVFYVMPVVDGESLRARIERERRLPVADAVRLISEVASALDYAHRQGVIHRDIKPENILLQDGRAMVADFGIALATASPGDRLTRAGLSLGTPEYMSPEQALGERELDARSDVYSLGVMLYEALTGAPPFTGATMQQIVGKVLTETPVPPSRLREELPPNLSTVILTAIEKDPERRFQTAALLEAALQHGSPVGPRSAPGVLRHWATWVTAAALGAAALFALLRGRSAPATGVTRHAIAVLPFVNQTRDTSKSYLSDGITRDLVDKLSNLRTIDVRDPSASMRFKDPNPDLSAVATALNVTDIITGRLEQLGKTLAVSVALHDVASKSQIWSTTYQPDVTRDLWRLYADIADSIALRLQVRPSDIRAAAGAQMKPDSAAHDLVLRARHMIESRDPVRLNQAIALFSDAILRAPDYANAWAGRATARSLLVAFQAAGPEEFRIAEVDVRRAISADSNLAEAHATLGFIQVLYYLDPRSASREFERAVELEPGRAETWLFRAWYYVAAGRLDSAIAATRRARALDPLSIVIAIRLGTVLGLADSTAAQRQAYREALALDSTNWQARAELALLFSRAGQCDSAGRASSGSPPRGNQFVMGWLESANALCGRAPEARSYLQQIEDRERNGGDVDSFIAATVYATLGDEANTRRWLELALTRHAFLFSQLRYHPAFREYRSRPWMQDLLRKAHLLS
jgi:eukaryotic-like serine/threonine-protein kinase